MVVVASECRRNATSRQDLRCLKRGTKIAMRMSSRKTVPPIAPPMIAALEWLACLVVVEDIGTGVFDGVVIVAGFVGTKR